MATNTNTPRMCSVEGCGGRFLAKGMCSRHYQQQLYADGGGTKACSVEGCVKPSKCQGYCGTHYKRFRTHGDAGDAKRRRARTGERSLHCGKDQCPAALKLSNHMLYLRQQPDRVKAAKEYRNERYRVDELFNLTLRLRGRMSAALKRGRYGRTRGKIIAMLGCTYAEFKAHIEAQFTPGMTWQKYLDGKIHIDHIRPCASFDLFDLAQQAECFNYRNMQPLWALDNLRKGARATPTLIL